MCMQPKEVYMQKDYQLYGTRILNLKTQEIGLLICIWKNKFADGEVDFVTCVDKQGKRYNIELDNISGFEDDFYKANSWDRVETCEPVSVMERSKMKVRNKLTKEIINISYKDNNLQEINLDVIKEILWT